MMNTNQLIKLVNYGAAWLILALICVAINAMAYGALWAYARHML